MADNENRTRGAEFRYAAFLWLCFACRITPATQKGDLTAGNSISVALKRILAGYEIFSADDENLIPVTKRRSRVRVGTESPQSNPSCPTAPMDLPLPGALNLGLGGRFGSRKFGFCSVEAGAPLTIFVRQMPLQAKQLLRFTLKAHIRTG